MRARCPLVLSTLLLALTVAAGAQDRGFVRLLRGNSMTESFVLVGVSPETYRIEDGTIICSGQPNGYFATKKSYRNYVLRFDWRYARPAGLQKDADFAGNSGLLLHIAGEHKVWPKCVEVQLMNRDAGNIFGLFGAKATARKDAAAQARAIRPVGEWNSEEVISQDGRITCKINGVVVCEATDCDPREGPIGWQSEGAEIHFRNLQIRELP